MVIGAIDVGQRCLLGRVVSPTAAVSGVQLSGCRGPYWAIHGGDGDSRQSGISRAHRPRAARGQPYAGSYPGSGMQLAVEVSQLAVSSVGFCLVPFPACHRFACCSVFHCLSVLCFVLLCGHLQMDYGYGYGGWNPSEVAVPRSCLDAQQTQ